MVWAPQHKGGTSGRVTIVNQDNGQIPRRKLSDEVRDRLLSEITDGNLAPGQLLPSERELMERYGVGRPAVREAMQALQGMGLIQVRHGERPKVAEPQLDQLYDQLSLTMRHVLTHGEGMLEQLKDARVMLEMQMSRVAAVRHDDTQIAGLRAIVADQRAASDSAERFMMLDGAFHQAVAAISGNMLLASVTRAIFAWKARFHVDAVRTPGLEQLTLSEHEAIVEAIASGDPDLAAVRMQEHLLRANALYSQANSTN